LPDDSEKRWIRSIKPLRECSEGFWEEDMGVKVVPCEEIGATGATGGASHYSQNA
jgi:hypothetical protein